MAETSEKTTDGLTPLFKTLAQQEPAPSALAGTIVIDGVFTVAGRGEHCELTLPDYQAVTALVDMKWLKDPALPEYRPNGDYTDEINSATILRPPEGADKFPGEMPATLVFLNDGRTLMTWLDSDYLQSKMADAETGALRALENISRSAGEYVAESFARKLIAEPLSFRAANAGNLQGSTDIQLRDARAVRDIIRLDWAKEESGGRYRPARHYSDELNPGLSFAPAFMPNDSTPYLPPSLVTLRDGRSFLSWEQTDTIAAVLDRAQNDAAARLANFMRNITYSQQQKLQAQPAPQRRHAAVETIAPEPDAL